MSNLTQHMLDQSDPKLVAALRQLMNQHGRGEVVNCAMAIADDLKNRDVSRVGGSEVTGHITQSPPTPRREDDVKPTGGIL